MKIEFKKLNEEHLEGVLEIERLSFKDPWSRELFKKEISLAFSSFFAVFADSRLAGYGGFWNINDEADIVNLAVHPDFRSKGIGRKILGHLLSEAEKKGTKKIFLEVRSGNENAKKLYESLGFKQIGKRKKYYIDEDAVVMEKELR